MKVAIIYNKDVSRVINRFGMQNKEMYKPDTIKMVAQALEAGGHNVGIIDGDMNVIERIQDFIPSVMEGERMGMVFNMAYGIQGEGRYTHIPSMLEMLGIPYVGSSPSGHALALDKVVTKIILQKYNLPTPEFWVFATDDVEGSDIKFPVIVKPKMESVSFGLRVVDNYADLKEAVKFIIDEFQQNALVEQFIPGREFAVGLLGNNPVEAFPVLEIDLENDPNAIQTYEHKTAKQKRKICPADLSEEKINEITQISIDAFKALQLRDFARVDLRMDKDGNVYILELNSMASLGATGSYPHAAKVAGYDFTALANRMLEVAARRYFLNPEAGTSEVKSDKKVPVQVKIRRFLRGREAEYVRILTSFVNTNTYVRNAEGVNNLADKLKKTFASLGLHFQSFNQIEVGNINYFSNSSTENIDILFLCNLDNDKKLNEHEYYHESELKLFGTGIWENKGGLVSLIAALQALRFTKQLRKIKIGILCTTDDSLQGKFAQNLITRFASTSRYVVGLHGAFRDGGIVTSRSGAAVYKLEMTHSQNDDAAGVAAAASQFLKIVTAMGEFSKPDDGLVIAPGNLNIETNITEPYIHSSVRLSVRFNDLVQMEETDKKIRTLLKKKVYKALKIQLDGGIRRPSMKLNENSEEFIKLIKKVAGKLDINLREEHRWSSADICYINNEKPLIDGVGPAGAKPNNKSEYILKHSLLERAALIASILIELTQNNLVE